MEERGPSCTVGEAINWYSHYGEWYRDTLKKRNKSMIWSNNSNTSIYPEKTTVPKDRCTPRFIAALFSITRTWKQPRCPSTYEWRKKIWYIYAMEYYSVIKKNKFESVLMRWMNLEPVTQSEVSQKEKKTNIIY